MDDDEFEDDTDLEDDPEDTSEDEDMMDDYEPDPDPRSTRIAYDANAAYKKIQRENKRNELWGEILGAGLIIVSILLGIADFVAPAVIIIFILYMVSRKR